MARSISATQWIFGRELLGETARRLADLGYDGIELAGEPDVMTASGVREVVEPLGLAVTSICGIYTPARDLSHPDAAVRRQAVEYVRRCVVLGSELGASVVIVVPTAVGRTAPVADEPAEFQLAVESIAEAAADLGAGGPRLVLEALNRYETYLVPNLARADELREAVGSRDVVLMADLFHMNIEEDDVPGAIRRHGAHIGHVHLADSNRREPGRGHTDFASVLAALDSVGYTGALTMEFLPPTANPYLAASLDVPADLKRDLAASALAHIRAILADGRHD
jgi:D-psicose/D-tagatose/L-ribulose 3-epimerase